MIWRRGLVVGNFADITFSLVFHPEETQREVGGVGGGGVCYSYFSGVTHYKQLTTQCHIRHLLNTEYI